LTEKHLLTLKTLFMSMRISGDNHLWPNGIIPFEIDTVDFPEGSSENNFILAAMNEWNSKTNITFIPRREEADYVHFKMGDAELALDSPVGRQGGRQDINGASLGFTAAPVIHEIGHAVGLFHEQGRQDRDAFVNVNMSNVLKKEEHNFIKEDGEQIGAYDYLSIMHYSRKLFPKDPLVDTVVPISWFGTETQAAGIAAADIAQTGSANDLVIFHIDNPVGGNAGYYRIIWGLKSDGTDNGMSELFQIRGPFGSENQGGAIAIADISGSGSPDLLVFFIDNPDGENVGYYRIGWDMDKNGKIASWSETFKVDGWFGSDSACGGVALAKLNDDKPWDMIVFHMDNPGGENTGYYRIGLDLDKNGRIQSWLPPVPISGGYGNETDGSGFAIGSIAGINNVMITFNIDNPDGDNQGYLRFGVLQGNGSVDKWTSQIQIPGWFGAENQDGDITIMNFKGKPSLIALHIDNPEGDNRAYLRIGSNLTPDGKLLTWSNVIPVHNFGKNAIDIIGNQQLLSALDIQAVNTMYPFKTVFGTLVRAGGWFGAETQGADVALADINGNGQQDMVIAFVDNPGEANKGYYRIGWNINAAGLVSNKFTAAKEIPGWWGNETAEVGVAIADISGNGKMDIIIMHIDNPDGVNQGFYRIGWNLDMNGDVKKTDWTDPIPIPNWVGDRTSAAGIAVADITGTGRPDLIVFYIDDPDGENHGYYRIGKDLNAAGIPAFWTGPIPIPGWFGNDNSGGGIAVKDLTGNGKPDLIIFHIDNPEGSNSGYYRIGRDLDRFGNPTAGWTRVIEIAGWFGNDNSGGGIAVADINGDGVDDFLVFHIDSPDGDNHGYYRTLFTPLLS
jgi:hypothetical protein